MQPSGSDHVYLDFELYLVFRSVSTIFAAIAAAVCLKGVHAEGKSEYLKYLVRALVVLVVVEVFFDIVQWFGTYDYCEDTQMQNEMRQYVHCMPHTDRSGMMGLDPSSSPLECEERMAKFDLPQTLLGVAINTCAPPPPSSPIHICSSGCGLRAGTLSGSSPASRSRRARRGRKSSWRLRSRSEALHIGDHGPNTPCNVSAFGHHHAMPHQTG